MSQKVSQALIPQIIPTDPPGSWTTCVTGFGELRIFFNLQSYCENIVAHVRIYHGS